MAGLKETCRTPLTVSVFRDELLRNIIRTTGPRVDEYGFRPGLAVSGGVDSMALAILCAKLQCEDPRFSFVALIVDHMSRIESTEQANITKRRLTLLGLKAFILPLQWPDRVPSHPLQGFETQARRLRYQTLGQYCPQSSRRFLLTAHHADDAAETLLMRLARGSTGLALNAMRSRSPLPECFGVHGINKSVNIEKKGRWLAQVNAEGKDLSGYSFNTEHLRRSVKSRPVLESGGIQVIKPFLGWKKRDLINICQTQHVDWEEDKTNQDLSLTPRNVVRHLLSHDQLPQALRTTSLLPLIARLEGRHIHRNYEFHGIMQCCSVIRLDIRSGLLLVRFVDRVMSDQSSDRTQKQLRAIGRIQRLAACVLKGFVSVVSPLEMVNLQGLEHAAREIFEDFRAQSDLSKDNNVSLTAGGVQFERFYDPIDGPAHIQGSAHFPEEFRHLRLNPDFVWRLSRQPSATNTTGLKIPPVSQATKTGKAGQYEGWSSWKLWDGRYWIRVKNNTGQHLRVRFYQERDADRLKMVMPWHRWRALNERIGLAAPGKIRWTLPVITQMQGHPADQYNDHVLALPSLGDIGRVYLSWDSGWQRMDWELRYKAISLRSSRLSQLAFKTDGRSQVRAGFSTHVVHDSNIFTSWNTV